MNPPETLDETIALFERTAKGFLDMDRLCVTEEAHENILKNVAWHMRLVEWLKELKERREQDDIPIEYFESGGK